MRAALIALAVLLGAALAAALVHDAPPPPAAPGPQAAAAPAAPAATPADASEAARAAAVQAMLARPLFSQSRRPPSVGRSVAAPSAAAALPRMTAILVIGDDRAALFADPARGKPVRVTEGGHIGAFTVERIEPGQVTVAGPGGTRTLRTSFDPAPAPAPFTAAPGPAPLAITPPFATPQFPPLAPPQTAGTAR